MTNLVNDAAFSAAFDTAYTATDAPAAPSMGADTQPIAIGVQATPAPPDLNTAPVDGQEAVPATQPGSTEESPDLFDGEFPDDQLHPDALTAKRLMQGRFTQRHQEMAAREREIQQQMEAIEAQRQQMAIWADLENQIANDPHRALQTIQQAGAQLAQALGQTAAAPASTPDPWGLDQSLGQESEFIPESPETRLLLQRVNSLETEVQQWRQQQFAQTAQQQLAGLESASGLTLSPLARAELIEQSRRANLPVETLFRGRYHDQLLAAAQKRARDEAAQIVQRKAQAAPPPAGVAARPTPATAPVHRTVDDFVNAALDHHQVRR